MRGRGPGFEATRQITLQTPDFMDPSAVDMLAAWRDACFGDGQNSREAILEAAEVSAKLTLAFYHVASGRASEADIQGRLAQRDKAGEVTGSLASNYAVSLRTAIALGEVVTEGATIDPGALDRTSRPKPLPSTPLGSIALRIVDGLSIRKRMRESRLVNFGDFVEQHDVNVQELFESAALLALQDEDALLAQLTYAGLLDLAYADRQSSVRLPVDALFKGWARRIADMQGLKPHQVIKRLEKRRELNDSVMGALDSARGRIQGADMALDLSMTAIIGDYNALTEGGIVPPLKRKLIELVEASEQTAATQELVELLRVGLAAETMVAEEIQTSEEPDAELILQEAATVRGAHQDVLDDWHIGREHRNAFRSVMDYLVRGGADSGEHWAVEGNEDKELSRRVIGLVHGITRLLDEYSVEESWQALAYSADCETELLDRQTVLRRQAEHNRGLRAQLEPPRERLRGTLESLVGPGTTMPSGVRGMFERHWPSDFTASDVRWDDVDEVLSLSLAYLRAED